MTHSPFQNKLAAALYQAASSSFEELAFFSTTADGKVLENSDDTANARTCAIISFSGSGTGTLVLIATDKMLPELAANMLGEAETLLSVDEQKDALGELANIICGNVLPDVGGERAVFDLAPPSVTNYAGVLESAAMGLRPVATACLVFALGHAEAHLFLDRETFGI